MKLSRIFYSLLIISALFFQSCDKIDAPFKEIGSGGNDTTEVRTVLLEDFTAQQCPNCPTASKVAQDLKDHYGNKLIIMAVHAGILAEPDSEYPNDYRTPAGNELYNDYGFGIQG